MLGEAEVTLSTRRRRVCFIQAVQTVQQQCRLAKVRALPNTVWWHSIRTFGWALRERPLLPASPDFRNHRSITAHGASNSYFLVQTFPEMTGVALGDEYEGHGLFPDFIRSEIPKVRFGCSLEWHGRGYKGGGTVTT